MKATCYHFRDMNGKKILGGSLPNGMTLDAAAAHVANAADVVVMNSGRVSFAHRGLPVWAYLSLDPEQTEKGCAALRAHREASALRAVLARLKGEAP